MAGVDDIIAEWVKRAEASGELEHGKYWGKPFDLDDGFVETPARLRMAYRILKNAGYVPEEIEMLKRLAELRECAAGETDPARRRALKRDAAMLAARLKVALEASNR